MIRVLLADDLDLFRQGVRALLGREPDIEVIGDATDGREAIDLARDLAPDVVVMDISMPELNGVDATRRILAAQPGTRVLALSVHVDPQVVAEMLRAGAAGYLVKTSAYEELVRAIRAVAGGERYLGPEASDVVVDGYLDRGPEPGGAPRLSTREREVLQLVAEGKSSKEAAARLGVSVKTIDSHRANLMRKLGVRSIAGLTKAAVRLGLTRIDG